MKKFTVKATITVTCPVELTVEAEDLIEAQKKAEAQMQADPLANIKNGTIKTVIHDISEDFLG